VQTPVTTMIRRSRQVPVTQTIARNYMVPVTSYEQRCAAEPVTETKLYYPATPTVAVPAPVTAAYLTPTPVAVPAPVAVPGPAVASAGYFAPTAPAPGMVPAPAAPAGPPGPAPTGQQPNNQFYQDPNAGQNANGTWVIERTVQDGRVIQENRKLVRPGEPIPPANPPIAPKEETPAPAANPETPNSSGWQPAPLKTIPVGHTAANARFTARVQPVSVAAAEYYR
jgi:hypothetical protein